MWKPPLSQLRQVAAWPRVNSPARVVAIFLAVLSATGFCAVAINMFEKPAHGVLVPKHRSLVWKGLATGGAGANSSARARFELDNVGGTPVRIRSVKSGCGCAKPVVRPEVVAPGHSAVVEVTALTVPVGEKVVELEVLTDSPIKPEVGLILKIVGMRKPPFLYLIEGEAVFLGDYSPEMSRDITVLTVEDRDRGASPEVVIDLPFLKSTLIGVEERHFIEPGTVLRRWKYRIEFTDRPPSGSFQGVLTAKSPWDAYDTLSQNVVGQLQSGLRAFPSTITLDRSGRETASLVVVCRAPSDRLDIVTEPSSRVPFIVKVEPGDGERRVHRLTVGLERPLTAGDTQTRFTIGQRGAAERLVVPVKIVSKK